MYYDTGRKESITENYDSMTDKNEFLLTIHSAVAQQESDLTSSRSAQYDIVRVVTQALDPSVFLLKYKKKEEKAMLVEYTVFGINVSQALPERLFYIVEAEDGLKEEKVLEIIENNGISPQV
jgi:hypothetical protein